MPQKTNIDLHDLNSPVTAKEEPEYQGTGSISIVHYEGRTHLTMYTDNCDPTWCGKDGQSELELKLTDAVRLRAYLDKAIAHLKEAELAQLLKGED